MAGVAHPHVAGASAWRQRVTSEAGFGRDGPPKGAVPRLRALLSRHGSSAALGAESAGPGTLGAPSRRTRHRPLEHGANETFAGQPLASALRGRGGTARPARVCRASSPGPGDAAEQDQGSQGHQRTPQVPPPREEAGDGLRGHAASRHTAVSMPSLGSSANSAGFATTGDGWPTTKEERGPTPKGRLRQRQSKAGALAFPGEAQGRTGAAKQQAGGSWMWRIAKLLCRAAVVLVATWLFNRGPFSLTKPFPAMAAEAAAGSGASAGIGAAATGLASVAEAGATGPGLEAVKLWFTANSPMFSAVWRVVRQQGLLLTALLALSAFFSMAETSITTLWPWKVREMAEKEPENSVFQLLRRDVTRFLTTILLGTTVVNIWATALVTEAATELFGEAGVNLATGVMTVLLLLFTEIAPKSIAVHNATQVIRVVVRPVAWLSVVLYPVGRVCTQISMVLLRMLGLESSAEPFVSEEELKLMLRGAEMSGAIEEDEQDMIENVLEIKDTYVREVMTPLVDVVAIDAAASLLDFRNLWAKQQYSRVPVYERRVDNIVGIAYAMDMLDYIEQPEFLQRLKIGRIAHRPAYFVPDSMSVWNLMREFRIRKVHMAIVLNEYGGTVGLVTLEDAVEEIVGEIFDENDSKEEIRKKTGYIIQRAEGVYDVDANTSIDDLVEAFQLNIPHESSYYETVSGFVCEAFGYIPRTGDKKVIRLRRLGGSGNDEDAGNGRGGGNGGSASERKKRGGNDEEEGPASEDEGVIGFSEMESDKGKLCVRDKDYVTFRLEILGGNAKKVQAVRFEVVDLCASDQPPASSAEAREKEREMEEEIEKQRERERERSLKEAWREEQRRQGRRREQLKELEGRPRQADGTLTDGAFALSEAESEGEGEGEEGAEGEPGWAMFTSTDTEDEEPVVRRKDKGNGRASTVVVPTQVIEPGSSRALPPADARMAAGGSGTDLARSMDDREPTPTLVAERIDVDAEEQHEDGSLTTSSSSMLASVPMSLQDASGSVAAVGELMPLRSLMDREGAPGGPMGRVVYVEQRSMRVELDVADGESPPYAAGSPDAYINPWEAKEKLIERRQQRRNKERHEATAELQRRTRIKRESQDRKL